MPERIEHQAARSRVRNRSLELLHHLFPLFLGALHRQKLLNLTDQFVVRPFFAHGGKTKRQLLLVRSRTPEARIRTGVARPTQARASFGFARTQALTELPPAGQPS